MIAYRLRMLKRENPYKNVNKLALSCYIIVELVYLITGIIMMSVSSSWLLTFGNNVRSAVLSKFLIIGICLNNLSNLILFVIV